VVNDIGSFDSVDTALTALYAEMPFSVRDAVIERLGGVRNLADLPGALDDVLARVVITGGIPFDWESIPLPPEPEVENDPPTETTRENGVTVLQRRTIFRRF